MSMLSQLIYKFRAWQLRQACRAVLDTPPIVTTDAKLVFVSMVQHKDVLPYLLAIKSVYRSFHEGGVIVLDDGSLSEADKSILNHHIQGVEIRSAQAVDLEGLQSGGTWERLVTLINESKHRYAVQVDADLVASGQLSEIVDLWKANISFALGNTNGPGKLKLSETGDYIRGEGVQDNPHVQIRSELAFETYENANERFYFRATSAFTGLAIGSCNMEQLKTFSKETDAALGSKWTEWGSEQVSSNYMVANCPDSRELSGPVYLNNTPGSDLSQARLIHFFGTHRYHGGRYLKHALDAIAALNKA